MFHAINELRNKAELDTFVDTELYLVLSDLLKYNVDRDWKGFPHKNAIIDFKIHIFRDQPSFYVYWKTIEGTIRKQLIGINGYIEKSKIQLIKKVFRRLIQYQVKDFKENNKQTHCPINGELLKGNVVEADHIIPFEKLATDFIKQYGEDNIIINKVDFTWYVDFNTRTHWINYHLCNAKLRLISYAGHMILNKSEKLLRNKIKE